MNVHKLCDDIYPEFEKIRDDDHIEVEIRLGKFNGTFFDTNLGRDTHVKLLKGFQKYDGWEQVIQTHEEVFYRERDNMRITVDENTGDETIIRKERVFKKDFKAIDSAPYDLRVSVAKEVPVTEEIEREMDKKRNKARLSYVRKNLSIDITTCTGDITDMDAEDICTYQVEFEIVDSKQIQTKDDLFKILYKIRDVFNLLTSNRC
jgi:hypothetical protein